MKRLYTTMFFFVLALPPVFSQENLMNWANEKAESHKAEDITILSFHPQLFDGKIIVSGTIDFPNKQDKDIFSSLLFWITTSYKKSRNVIFKIDTPQFRCATQTSILSTKYNGEGVYYSLKSVFQADKNKLNFQIYDIRVNYLSGLIPTYKEVPLEDLMPNLSPKKDKHITYLDEFIKGNNETISRIVHQIKKDPPPPITHWDEINNSKLIAGMNFIECTLSVGCPLKINTTKVGTSIHEQWVYDNNKYLYFEDGILISMQY